MCAINGRIVSKVQQKKKQQRGRSFHTWTSAPPRLRDAPEAEARSPSLGLDWSLLAAALLVPTREGGRKEEEEEEVRGRGCPHCTKASLKRKIN